MEKPNVIPSMILLLRSIDTGGICERLFLFPLVLRELRPELLFGGFCFEALRPEFRTMSPEFCAVPPEFCTVPPDLRRFSAFLFRALRPAAGVGCAGWEPALDLLSSDMFTPL